MIIGAAGSVQRSLENATMTETTTSDNEYRQQRLANMEALKNLGYEPFGHAFARTARLSEIRAGFEEGKKVTAAGRLTTIRDMGKSIFADLNDGSDRFQIYVQKKAVGDDVFAAFKLLDIGDFIGVEGDLFEGEGEKVALARALDRYDLYA